MALRPLSDFSAIGETTNIRYKNCLLANLEMAQFSPLPCTRCFTGKQQQVPGSITPFAQAEGKHPLDLMLIEWQFAHVTVPEPRKNAAHFCCVPLRSSSQAWGAYRIQAALHAAHPCQKTFPPLKFNPSTTPKRYRASRVRTNFLSRHEWTFRTANTSVGTPWV